MLKRLVIVGVTIPLALIGYRFFSETAGVGVAQLAGRSPLGIGEALGGDPDHDLTRLSILERDLYIIKQRYVDKDRLNADVMFTSALVNTERKISEVMFVREPGGDKLHISVGAYSTILPLKPLVDLDDLYSELSRVAEILDDNLSDEVDRAGVEYALINGALSSLDPHSVLLPPRAAEEMEVDNQGEFGGLGIEITSRNGMLTVKQPMPDTPAAEVGIQADDHIIRIEDESTINMDLSDAVGRLRGEVGTSVTIEVARKGQSRPLPFTITRAVIRTNPVEGELLEGNVGYIRIISFHANVSEDLDNLLTRFGRESTGDVQGLILDLRGNPGGYLNQAIAVCDRFLKDGIIVSTVEGSDQNREVTRAERDGDEPSYPIAILVNGSSASASEIVAGALRNRGRALILGERSFGKGSVQHLYNHRDQSRLKLTVAQYLTPGDRSIQSVGIPPDVLLQPSVVRPATDTDEQAISLYWRERLEREADLDHHLDHASASLDDEIPLKLRYLRPENSESSEYRIDPNGDWEVGLAREIILASSSARRADILQAAAPIIARYAERESASLSEALAGVGIDWTKGDNPESLTLSVKLDLGSDGVLVAGEEEQVGLEVTNTSSEPLYQISALTRSDNRSLDAREFYFGTLAPGETKRFEQRVALPAGYGEEIASIDITFRDPSHPALLTTTQLIETSGEPLPKLAYRVALFDDGSGNSRGNGNGLPEVGEIIDLEVTVFNEGEGATREAYARLKNRSGRTLDLKTGVIEIGDPRNSLGETCDPDDLAPSAEEGACTRRLESGAQYAGRFSFELREPVDSDWSLELQVGDNRAYDYTTISRGGFYDYFRLEEAISLSPERALEVTTRHGPSIEVTRRPPLQIDDTQTVISGVVRDDRGVRDVVIFQGEDKVFFRGGTEDGTELPFTVEQELSPGLNHLHILARDYQGMSSTLTVGVWLDTEAPEQQASVIPE
ncbi:MAG: carboxyl-terminal processing protease [Myxococcota bacterium]|jgi:carboxyl-terminal processing protease